VVFVVSAVLLHFLIGPPTTCNDGWHSPSIGRQGACSWHGGVNNTPQFLGFVASVLLGLIAFAISSWLEQRSVAEEQETVKNERVPISDETLKKINELRELARKRTASEITCPLCGSIMQKRLARRGPRSGKYFWGCSRYPTCRGTRNL
jgi:ssDNA-binding Zn-finger/Zn-ribbon topoisomerase 1